MFNRFSKGDKNKVLVFSFLVFFVSTTLSYVDCMFLSNLIWNIYFVQKIIMMPIWCLVIMYT